MPTYAQTSNSIARSQILKLDMLGCVVRWTHNGWCCWRNNSLLVRDYMDAASTGHNFETVRQILEYITEQSGEWHTITTSGFSKPQQWDFASLDIKEDLDV